jgi:hypothetical protein
MKMTIEEMRQIAKERGGRCLSDNYINVRTKLLWQCSKGHQWRTTSDVIKTGCWCPICGRKKSAEARKLGIEAMRQLAKERGGKCLSKSYVGANTKLLWQCAEGHQWEGIPNNVKRGSWCFYCAQKKRGEIRKLDIEEMRQLASERGGKCLSDSYVNIATKLLWECAEGHRWKATPLSIKRGTWCRVCARMRKKSTIAGKTEATPTHGRM